MNFLIPLAAALLPSITPGPWDGFCGTSKCSPGHETVEDCATALSARGPGNYACRTITRVVVSEYDDDVVLSWTPPTKNTDGSTLVNLAKYRVQYGPAPTQMNLVFEIQEPGATAWTVTGLSIGAWYFTILACNTQGACSVPTSPVSKVL